MREVRDEVVEASATGTRENPSAHDKLGTCTLGFPSSRVPSLHPPTSSATLPQARGTSFIAPAPPLDTIVLQASTNAPRP